MKYKYQDRIADWKMLDGQPNKLGWIKGLLTLTLVLAVGWFMLVAMYVAFGN